jgi:hypothetical protein
MAAQLDFINQVLTRLTVCEKEIDPNLVTISKHIPAVRFGLKELPAIYHAVGQMRRPVRESASAQLETVTILALYLNATQAGEVQSGTAGVGSQAMQDTSDFIYKYLEYFRQHPRLHTDGTHEAAKDELQLADEVLVWHNGIEPVRDPDDQVTMLGCIFNIEVTYRAILTYA